MPVIKGILLDYDGVVATVDVEIPTRRLARIFGLTPRQADQLFQMFWPQYVRGRLDDEALWKLLSTQLGVQISTYQKSQWATAASLHPIDGMLELIHSLRDSGIVIGLLTNVTIATEQQLNAKNAYTGFDFAIKSCEVGYAKPEEEIYRLALNKFTFTPNEVLFVDDRPNNLKPAQKLGMKTIHARNGPQTIADIKTALSPQHEPCR